MLFYTIFHFGKINSLFSNLKLLVGCRRTSASYYNDLKTGKQMNLRKTNGICFAFLKLRNILKNNYFLIKQ